MAMPFRSFWVIFGVRCFHRRLLPLLIEGEDIGIFGSDAAAPPGGPNACTELVVSLDVHLFTYRLQPWMRSSRYLGYGMGQWYC